MHARHRSRTRIAARGVALALAYLLVLQGLLVGLTSGLQAAPAMEGTAWALCSGAAHPAPGAPAPADHADCCVLGCSMFGPGVAPVPVVADLTDIDAAHAVATLPKRDAATFAGGIRSPRSTRGPPYAA